MIYSELDMLELYADADFYDQEFAHRDFELPFYTRILQGRKSVVEVACGSGRLTIPLYQAGIPICGTDLSPAMIEKAQTNAESKALNISFCVQDACHLSDKYDAIFIATNSLQHLLTIKQAEAFLLNSKNCLNEHGILILDLQVPDVKRLARPAGVIQQYKTFKLGDKQINATIKSEYHQLSQLYEFYIHYYNGDECIKQKHAAMRMYYPQELQYMIKQAGLRVIENYGSYDFAPLTESSEKQIYILTV